MREPGATELRELRQPREESTEAEAPRGESHARQTHSRGDRVRRVRGQRGGVRLWNGFEWLTEHASRARVELSTGGDFAIVVYVSQPQVPAMKDCSTCASHDDFDPVAIWRRRSTTAAVGRLLPTPSLPRGHGTLCLSIET